MVTAGLALQAPWFTATKLPDATTGFPESVGLEVFTGVLVTAIETTELLVAVPSSLVFVARTTTNFPASLAESVSAPDDERPTEAQFAGMLVSETETALVQLSHS
jgi:hypothetical protein